MGRLFDGVLEWLDHDTDPIFMLAVQARYHARKSLEIMADREGFEPSKQRFQFPPVFRIPCFLGFSETGETPLSRGLRYF